MMRLTVIVGAGPAGLFAAWRLAVEKKKLPVLLVDAAGSPGGAAGQCALAEGVAADLGMHRLSQQTPAWVVKLLREAGGEKLDLVPTRGSVYLNGKYFRFPVSVADLVTRFRPSKVAQIACGMAVSAGMGRLGLLTGRRSLKHWCVARFGKPFFKTFYEAACEKQWGMNPASLSVEASPAILENGWASVVFSSIGGVGQWSKSPYFYYPETGLGTMWAAIAAKIEGAGAEVRYNSRVLRIEVEANRAVGIEIAREGGKEKVECDRIIFCAPVQELVSALGEAAADGARTALASRAMVVLYLLLDLDRFSRQQFYLFPERRFPFACVFEQKAFSSKPRLRGRTVIGIEIPCQPKDYVFSATPGEIFEKIEPALRETGLGVEKHVHDLGCERILRARPVYHKGFEADVKTIYDEESGLLSRFENVYPAGAGGLFLDVNVGRAAASGWEAAKLVSADKRAVQWLRRARKAKARER